ncbi:MAG: PIG-L deacetylase family protein [Jannaschia sp.]
MRAVQNMPCGPAPVIVLAPHPDDESLGCGLLLAEIWRRGGEAHVMCLTDGAASHRGSAEWSADRLAALRRAELSGAVAELGGDPTRDVTWLGFPDAALHRVHGPGDDPVRSILALVDDFGAGTLVAASPSDPHCDHLAGARAALRVKAARPGLNLLFYPIWSRWQLHEAGADADSQVPIVLDLPRHRSAKRAAIAAHRSQMGQVVADDPDGFVMPDGFADYFAEAPEHYFPVGR